ncbi:MAG: formyltransferase family protein [Candidatus Sulfotelmatobacter sp.]
MRIVVLGSSVYSETGCAVVAHLAEQGHAPVGALVLTTLNRGTLLRKLGQWGVREAARYARTKLVARRGGKSAEVNNPYLRTMLSHENGFFRSLREVGSVYGFPIVTCRDQNSPASISQLKQWAPDLIIFTGGNILRKQLLNVPRLGVLNIHLGLLPEIRGMSSPEWSLLNQVPVGITVHYMDAGIDTGPILQRSELPDVNRSKSLSDLRHRLIAFGVEKAGEVVAGIAEGTIAAAPQAFVHSTTNHGSQFFVMHERLQAPAAERLANVHSMPSVTMVNG